MQPKTIKDFEKESRSEVKLRTETKEIIIDYLIKESRLKQLIIAHIKYMRRSGRDLYFQNIDEKSAIPKLMEIFNLNEEDVK